MKIRIINGPNLNLTGKRELEIYGSKTFEGYLTELKQIFPDTEIDYFQSNIEGELINSLQEADDHFDGIIINAGAYTHTSVAIYDAIKAIGVPVVEVHMSNILAREDFRHKSLLAGAVVGSVMGFGLDSYRLAILSFS